MFLTLQEGGFKAPPRPHSSEIFESILAEFSQKLDRSAIDLTPCSYQTFIDHFEGPKRKAYQRAYDAAQHSFPPLKELAEVNIFVKFEKNFKSGATPRCINPRDILFRVKHGIFSYPMDKPILRAVNKAARKHSKLDTVFKGKNQHDRGTLLAAKWGRFKRPVCVLKDAKRMDQHVSDIALSYTHKRYLKYYHGKDRQDFKLILDHMIENKFSARCFDGYLSGKIRGGRMSGDNDTGTGNILLMVAMDVSYAESKGIPDYEIFNDGDDSGIIFEAEHLETYQQGLAEWFLQLGFSMEIEKPVYVLEEIKFCQSQPVFDGVDYLMVRDPRTAIRKDAVSLTPLRNGTEYSNWTKSVGVGGMALAGQIPLWQAFYASLLRASPNGKVSSAYQDYGLKMKIEGMKRREGPISAEARVSFYKAFDIEPAYQVILEQRFDALDLSFDGIDCDQLGLLENFI
jgi:hypothetical protein